ncbi:MAG TPA: hypothetical protein VK564_02960, partial [Thermodesulfobacteriota bacterium]|nr:hypothetical protein [Thermodesulfobacteriota bacterium]
MPRSPEAIIRALKHQPSKVLPRGELFLYQDFLDSYFGCYQGNYLKQLAAAGGRLGLSLIGVELNNKGLPELFHKKNFQDLASFYAVGCLNGPVSGLIEAVGFLKAMLSTKNNPSLFSEIAAAWLDEAKKKTKEAKAGGLRAIAIADDLAGNQGLFFSPVYFQEKIWPIY